MSRAKGDGAACRRRARLRGARRSTRPSWRVMPGRAILRACRVFILGMPRSGSSLIEHILASHPALSMVPAKSRRFMTACVAGATALRRLFAAAPGMRWRRSWRSPRAAAAAHFRDPWLRPMSGRCAPARPQGAAHHQQDARSTVHAYRDDPPLPAQCRHHPLRCAIRWTPASAATSAASHTGKRDDLRPGAAGPALPAISPGDGASAPRPARARGRRGV